MDIFFRNFWANLSYWAKEFFGLHVVDGNCEFLRDADGYMSWQHLTFVTSLMIIMTAAAILLGLHFKKKDMAERNKVLVWSAILINAFELIKIITCCLRADAGDISPITKNLPLFLCSIQLIAIPLAAFAKGRLKNAALDFVFIFGILGAIMGTYFAGQNYGSYPVLSFVNVISGITHSISGFASLYIVISKMASMKKRNIWITFSILTGFCVAAYIANVTIDYNYMFLMAGDGTPYDIIFNLVGGHPVIYPFLVWAIFIIYITAFYFIYFFFRVMKQKRLARLGKA